MSSISSEELANINKNVDEFISNNKEKFDVMSDLQNQLRNINNSSFAQVIAFIEKHKKIFFNDHPSAIFFINYMISYSYSNFKIFELILDICIYFSKDFKNELTQVTENEIMDLSLETYTNSVNYFFMKHFITIEAIIKKSFTSQYIFYNFLPEIEQYDHEYSELMKKKYSKEQIDEDLQKFIQTIQNDYQKHILNRNLNYNPSSLHKSIRDDDIELFQSLVSQNNIKLNDPIQFSFYERAKTKCHNLCPIKVAAIYESVKIFKFLLMNDVIIDDDLLDYAYNGTNAEIIHLIENKCPIGECYIQPIVNYHNELLDYFIDNYKSSITEDIKFQFNDSSNEYNVLNCQCLQAAIITGNYPIIRSCLKKIVFISRNFDLIEIPIKEYDTSKNLFNYMGFDFDLLKFIFSQKKPGVRISKCGMLYESINLLIEINANDSFKFLFSHLKDDLNILSILQSCIEFNHEIAIFLLDEIIKEKENNNTPKSMYQRIKSIIDYSIIKNIFKSYNEDVLVKVLQLFELINTFNDLSNFIQNLNEILTTKMLFSLFGKLTKILRRDLLIYLAAAYEDDEKTLISEFIKMNLPKKLNK